MLNRLKPPWCFPPDMPILREEALTIAASLSKLSPFPAFLIGLFFLILCPLRHPRVFFHILVPYHAGKTLFSLLSLFYKPFDICFRRFARNACLFSCLELGIPVELIGQFFKELFHRDVPLL